ncbi:MAG: hypothetical protein LC748_00195, partial [Thermomicrobia bacterium]|nr:hypothetical protein [Thermomicrobia bacterium]
GQYSYGLIATGQYAGINAFGVTQTGVIATGGTVGVSAVSQGSGASAIGVSGTSSGTYGLYGMSSQPGGVGVGGNCTGGYGVLGTVSDGYGVLGQATTGNGLYGFSQQNHAVVGQTARPYYGGVLGIATIANTVGIYGSTKSGSGNVASAYAGYMDGNFVVANGFKSGAVAHADGTHRLVYCVESPESWLEDFGEAQLVNGKAEVRLDAEFAAIIETTGYHVFLTEYGDHTNLFVETRSATAFTVAAKGTVGAVNAHGIKAGSGTFGYRVVAKRKDIQAERLAKFDVPGKATHETKPPQVPAPPSASAASRRP